MKRRSWFKRWFQPIPSKYEDLSKHKDLSKHGDEHPSEHEKGHSPYHEATLSRVQWLMVIGGIGMGLLILSSFFQKEPLPVPESLSPSETEALRTQAVPGEPKKFPEDKKKIETYEHQYEEELKVMLEEVIGIGHVSVMVNLDSTEETVVEKNVRDTDQTTKETDSQGATREVEEHGIDHQAVIYNNGQGEMPLIIKEKRPIVRGVLVVAEGADHPQIKAWIIEGVQRVLDVPAHRISVLPRKSGGGS